MDSLVFISIIVINLLTIGVFAMTLFDKENALLAGQVAQGKILVEIASAIARLSAPQNIESIVTAIALVDTHVNEVKAIIGQEATPEVAIPEAPAVEASLENAPQE